MQLKQGFRLWWLVVPVLAADRLTKLLVQRTLAPRGVRTVLPGVLSWAYTENRGAAFSMLSGWSLLLPVLTLLLIAGLVVYLLRSTEIPLMERAGLWFIVGGGLGNLWDRLTLGCVVDFIRLDFVRFAVFNAADVFICTGAALVILSVMLSEVRRKRHG